MRLIPLAVRQKFQVPDRAPDFLDALIATLHEVLADDDRTWPERLGSIPDRFEKLLPGGEFSKIDHWLAYDEDALKDRIEKYAARFKNGSAKRFLKQLLGSKRFLRLEQAFNEDWALCLLGLRRLLRGALPLFQALEDAAALLSDTERSAYASVGSEGAFLRVAMQMDELISAFLEKREMNFTGLHFPARTEEDLRLDVDIDALMEMLHIVLDVEMETRASELSETIRRKYRGFEQALANSDDGVGQAATSLIEMIDRMLRTACTTGEVLEWIQTNRPDDKSLTHVKDGRLRPTKRGEALCFAYAGLPPGDDSAFYDMLAATIVAARTAAQQIKHADHGTPEEAEELRQLMQSTRGALTVILRISWIMSDERYTTLKDRFATAA
jgi:hypothetical protein